MKRKWQRFSYQRKNKINFTVSSSEEWLYSKLIKKNEQNNLRNLYSNDQMIIKNIWSLRYYFCLIASKNNYHPIKKWYSAAWSSKGSVKYIEDETFSENSQDEIIQIIKMESSQLHTNFTLKSHTVKSVQNST